MTCLMNYSGPGRDADLAELQVGSLIAAARRERRQITDLHDRWAGRGAVCVKWGGRCAALCMLRDPATWYFHYIPTKLSIAVLRRPLTAITASLCCCLHPRDAAGCLVPAASCGRWALRREACATRSGRRRWSTAEHLVRWCVCLCLVVAAERWPPRFTAASIPKCPRRAASPPNSPPGRPLMFSRPVMQVEGEAVSLLVPCIDFANHSALAPNAAYQYCAAADAFQLRALQVCGAGLGGAGLGWGGTETTEPDSNHFLFAGCL